MSMRLIFVEDNEGMRIIVRRLLQPMTSRFIETTSLARTFEFVQLEYFDIVLLDLVLLDSMADETIAAIPKIKELAHAPVVVLSGVLDPSAKDRCLAAGAAAFVPKETGIRFTALSAVVAAAVLRNPKPRGNDWMQHVELLERLALA